MVSVAKNFDAPIKLLFPRLGLLDSGKRPFSMLGLGDIVIPGIFVALMLRYDVKNGFRTKYFQVRRISFNHQGYSTKGYGIRSEHGRELAPWTYLQPSINVPFLQSCFGGYVLGLSTTLFVMIAFNVSQVSNYDGP